MKKIKKSFIGVLLVGIVMIIESIIMKYVMPAQTISFNKYMLYGGIAVAAVGLIGLIVVSLKGKKKPEVDTESSQPVNSLGGQDGSETAAVEMSAQDTERRVKREVALSGGDNLRIKTFTALSIMYAVITIVSVVGYFTAFGMKDGDGVTICKAICLAYALIMPSYLVYIGFGKPFRLNKAINAAIAVVGIVAMVVCLLIGFSAISNLPNVENEFWEFVLNIFIYLALVCAVVGYGVIYGFVCKGANSVWYLGFGLGFTVLFPVVAALIVALFIICFLIGAIKWILSSLGVMTADTSFGKGFISGWTGKIMHKNQYTYTDENGYSHTVYSDNGTDFYNVDGSYAGHSDDNGRHIS